MPTIVSARLTPGGPPTASEWVAHSASTAMPPTMIMARARGSGHASVAAMPTMKIAVAATSQAVGTGWRSNWRSAATAVLRPISIVQLPRRAGTHSGTWPCSMCAAAAAPSSRLATAHSRRPGMGWRMRRSSASTTMLNTTHSAATTASSERPSIVMGRSRRAISGAWALFFDLQPKNSRLPASARSSYLWGYRGPGRNGRASDRACR